MQDDAMAAGFERCWRLAADAGLFSIVQSTSYGALAICTKKRAFIRMKDPDTLVLLCPLEQKELLMASAPEIYFETDHYSGWPAVLVRLKAIGDEELRLRLVESWLDSIGERDRRRYLQSKPPRA